MLTTLAAMRAQMRNVTLGRPADESIAAAVGMTSQEMYEMYRLLAIAKYDDRYVIPKAHVEQAHDLEEMGCSLDFDGGPYENLGESGPFGEASGRPTPVAVETFQALQAAADLRRRRLRLGAARPGEPAELGRQRRAGGDVPARQRDPAAREAGAGMSQPAHADRVVWQAASLVLGLPGPRGWSRRAALIRAALADAAPHRLADFAAGAGLLGHAPPRPRCRTTTSRSSTCPAGTRST